MELTIEQYKKMRLSGMTDQEILKTLHYAPGSKRGLQRWKKVNGIKLGKDKTQFLDKWEVYEYLKTNSMLETAAHFGVNVQSLYRWEKEQRRI